jgi:CheY-like chemotaxis protein
MTARAPSVLLVDDEPLIARLHARAVQAMGFQPRFASDGYEALDHVAQEPPALILTDLNMPALSGFGLAEKLVQHQAKHCPIVLMSGDDSLSIIEHGLNAGVDDFLVKGMPFAMLTERLRFWIDGPFRALPSAIRASAQEVLLRKPPAGPPIQRLRAPAQLLVDRARATLVDLLLFARDGYGLGEIERLRIAGALDGILASLSRSSALAQLRRPDMMLSIITSLKVPWRAALIEDVLSVLDSWADDPTFRHARETLTLL